MTDLTALERPRRYGCIPDHPDKRDLMFAAPRVALPAKVDLSAILPPVLGQGQIGSWTGHGSSEAVRAARIKAGHPDVPLSRPFPYYNGRAYEGTTDQDAGAMIRDVVKGLVKFGCATEALWPYSSPFDDKPYPVAYRDGATRQVLEYRRVVVSAMALKAALAAGYPAIIGISVYASFEGPDVARTGVVPMPVTSGPGAEDMLGGHCMLCWGYDDGARTFAVRNSWGESWGWGGNCHIPYDYLGDPDLASDFWTLTEVEAPATAA